jgi:hypothetical protein
MQGELLKSGKFRHQKRKEGGNQKMPKVQVGSKRRGDPMEVEEDGRENVKKAKGTLTGATNQLAGLSEQPYTSGKKGFHSPPLVPNVFDPRLKGPSVPVHLKMWARGISPSSNGPFGPGFSHQPGLMPLGL